ncbi:MAG: glycosyltransferase [bacterium]|nr:glycosyltransferase [bacterium]
MKSKIKVVHLSPTPLVGAPSRISNALNKYANVDSTVVLFSDYPGNLKGKFLSDSITFFDKGDDFKYKFIIGLINEADILHIHNFLKDDLLHKIYSDVHNSELKYVYHCHSPLREGPLFHDQTKSMGIDFSLKLAVSQYNPRIFQDYKFAPNIINFKPSLKLIKNDEKIKILISPAHKRTGFRWNQKYSKHIDEVLKSLKKLQLIELIDIVGYSPHEIFEIRKNTHITIDEVLTGAFHQISLEGLAAGNVVINNSDWASLEVSKNISINHEAPPFLITDEKDFEKTILDIINNRKKLRYLQEKSYKYFLANLLPELLVKYYVRYYKEIIRYV